MSDNILQYEPKIWSTADLLRGSGIKESEWPGMMMPFFALVMIESRLVRMFAELKAELGEATIAEMDKSDLFELINDKGQGYNAYIFERGMTLKDICKNDKAFELDFNEYLKAFDGETKDLLGVDASEGEKFLDIRGVIATLKAKKILMGYAKDWSAIDLLRFNNSEITTLEEHIKRKWADMSAETAGEQYTPDDIIALISEIIASKVKESDQLLKIYDCTCGGGNLLFGVEDRIKKKFKRFTATYGQDWNDALYAMARIESRFREDSKIEYGNTLTDDKFANEDFDVATSNPPYGVDWKGYAKSIEDDKTGRFHFIPSTEDGQLLFMQHIIAKLSPAGFAVIVHSGSTLTSGDPGSPESNVRKWLLDNDLVEAVIQNPASEFFNTDINTYLWIINKNKPSERKNEVLLIDASNKFRPLKKSKGDKNNEIDQENIKEIVTALTRFEDCAFARRLNKFYLYYNRQTIELTNLDDAGKSYAEHLPMVEKRDGTKEKADSLKLEPVALTNGETTIKQFTITTFDAKVHATLADAFEQHWKPLLAGFDYREQPVVVTTAEAKYHFDTERETLVKAVGKSSEPLGCGCIVIKTSFKAKNRKQPERIEISVELTPDTEKDSEVIPYHPNPEDNQSAIDAFMAKFISKPFAYIERTTGVSINFNSIFPFVAGVENFHAISDRLKQINTLTSKIESLRKDLSSVVLLEEKSTKVDTKDSGYTWIGKIPETWTVCRIVDVAKEVKFRNKGLQEKNLLSLSYGKIKRKDINSSAGLLPESFETYQIVSKGNIVLRLTDLQNDRKSLECV